MVAVNLADPRVKRTRQLLQQAFLELMGEKGFRDISVQDIADRATVNRATFYTHFEDKYALFDHIVENQFREALASRLTASCAFSMTNLHLLILVALEFLGRMGGHCRLSDKDLDQLQRKVQQELYTFILNWLTQTPPVDRLRSISLETTATVVSWAIFGAGVQWGRSPGTASPEGIADDILTVIAGGLSRVVNVPLLE